VAGKREKASFELYSALARVAGDRTPSSCSSSWPTKDDTKRRVEAMYDELVYQDN